MLNEKKRNWFKTNPNAVRSTAVREGYQRYTTYFATEMLEWVRSEADKQDKWMVDIIGEALDEYKRRAEGHKKAAKNSNR